MTYFKIPYDIYNNEFKGSLIRLKWNSSLKMFETVNEKEDDLPSELMKYRVNFFYCPYVDKDDVKEHKAMWCNEKKMWYYLDKDNTDFFKKYRIVNIDMI